MAAINLSSLSTFWASIKSYLAQHLSDETVLWTGTSDTATLSESLYNFESFRVDFSTNDDVGYSVVFSAKVIVGGEYEFALPAWHVNTSASTNRSYFKVGLAECSSDYLTFTCSASNQVNINASNISVTKYTGSSRNIFVKKITGLKRIVSQ